MRYQQKRQFSFPCLAAAVVLLLYSHQPSQPSSLSFSLFSTQLAQNQAAANEPKLTLLLYSLTHTYVQQRANYLYNFYFYFLAFSLFSLLDEEGGKTNLLFSSDILLCELFETLCVACLLACILYTLTALSSLSFLLLIIIISRYCAVCKL